MEAGPVTDMTEDEFTYLTCAALVLIGILLLVNWCAGGGG